MPVGFEFCKSGRPPLNMDWHSNLKTRKLPPRLAFNAAKSSRSQSRLDTAVLRHRCAATTLCPPVNPAYSFIGRHCVGLSQGWEGKKLNLCET